MSRTLSFTVPGEPRGKGRPRAARQGGFVRVYTDDKTAAYENLVALAATQALAGKPPITEPVVMVVTARVTPAASASKRSRSAMLNGEIAPAKKPDLTNILKAVEDGLNRVAYADDSQIVRIVATKRYAETPGVDVTITTLGEAA